MVVMRVLVGNDALAVCAVHGMRTQPCVAHTEQQRLLAGHLFIERDVGKAMDQIEVDGGNAWGAGQRTAHQRGFIRAVHVVHVHAQVRHRQEPSAATAS
jgi:hypothetical protein